MEYSLASILTACQDQNLNVRSEAEEKLTNAINNNPGALFVLLATELNKEAQDHGVRQLAGLVLKNALTKKSKRRKAECANRWVSLSEDHRNSTKELCMQTLASSHSSVLGDTAAQVISAISSIELPNEAWPSLIGQLNDIIAHDTRCKRVVYTCINYILEEFNDTDSSDAPIQVDCCLTEQHLNSCTEMLFTGIHGCVPPTGGCTDCPTALVALKAVFFLLPLIPHILTHEAQRKLIIDTICSISAMDSITRPEIEDIRVAALECLVRVCKLHYDFLNPFIEIIGEITFSILKNLTPEGDCDTIGLVAIEAWSTIAEEEVYRTTNVIESRGYIKQSARILFPILCEKIAISNTEEDGDSTWNITMAAATCLGLVALELQDTCAAWIVEFIEANYNHSSWSRREAAFLAYGSVIEGLSDGYMRGLVETSLPFVLESLDDTSVNVRDTSCWLFGRMCQFHGDVVTSSSQFPSLMDKISEKIQDKARVSSQACWVLDILAQNSEGETANQTTKEVFSSNFLAVIQALLNTSMRPDGEEHSLRLSCYSAVSSIVSTADNQSDEHLSQLLVEMLNRLESIIQIDQGSSFDLHGHICGVIQVVIQKIKDKTHLEEHSRRLMNLCMSVMRSFISSKVQSATLESQLVPSTQGVGTHQVADFSQVADNEYCIHEDALMAVCALARAIGVKFVPYLPEFVPIVVVGVNNPDEYYSCQMSLGAVGDICRALGQHLVTEGGDRLLTDMMTAVVLLIRNPDVDIRLKPYALASLSDVVLSVKSYFKPYLPQVLDVCVKAASVSPSQNKDYDDDDTWVSYVYSLKAASFEVFSGIIHSFKDAPEREIIVNNLPQIIDSVKTGLHSLHPKYTARGTTEKMHPFGVPTADYELVKASIGLLGDVIIANLDGPNSERILVRQFTTLARYIQSYATELKDKVMRGDMRHEVVSMDDINTLVSLIEWIEKL